MNLQGKKTYIVGVIVLVVAVAGKYFNAIDGATTIELISVALLAMGLRNGIR